MIWSYHMTFSQHCIAPSFQMHRASCNLLTTCSLVLQIHIMHPWIFRIIFYYYFPHLLEFQVTPSSEMCCSNVQSCRNFPAVYICPPSFSWWGWAGGCWGHMFLINAIDKAKRLLFVCTVLFVSSGCSHCPPSMSMVHGSPPNF